MSFVAETQFNPGQCPICLEEFTQSEEILSHEDNLRQRTCAVHQRCLNQWIETPDNDGTCPICRERITSINGIEIPAPMNAQQQEALRVANRRTALELGLILLRFWVINRTDNRLILFLIPGALEGIERQGRRMGNRQVVRLSQSMQTGRNAFYLSIPFILVGILMATHNANDSLTRTLIYANGVSGLGAVTGGLTGRVAVAIPFVIAFGLLAMHTPDYPSIENVISPIANVAVLGGLSVALAGIARVHQLVTCYFTGR